MASNICFMTNNGELTPLGRWIKAALDAKGRKQAWLADKVGLKPPQISRIMRGGSEALPSVLDAIADALGKRRSEIYRAAKHLEPISKKDDIDENILFHSHRLPIDERERWLKRIEADADDYEQRKASRSTNKTRTS